MNEHIGWLLSAWDVICFHQSQRDRWEAEAQQDREAQG
jgi:hypothetical protein